jgi:hypothetical protein
MNDINFYIDHGYSLLGAASSVELILAMVLGVITLWMIVKSSQVTVMALKECMCTKHVKGHEHLHCSSDHWKKYVIDKEGKGDE